LHQCPPRNSFVEAADVCDDEIVVERGAKEPDSLGLDVDVDGNRIGIAREQGAECDGSLNHLDTINRELVRSPEKLSVGLRDDEFVSGLVAVVSH
jgi:hypothetical protein